MAKVKTGELTDAALDYAVGVAEGYDTAFASAGDVIILREGVTDYFDPHRNWGWVGPIVERECIGLWPSDSIEGMWAARPDYEVYPERLPPSYGPTPLIAAMRCFCYSKLGDEVEVPEELI